MGDVAIPINFLAVFGAAIVSMIIGSVWYGPLLGKTWMKEIGMTPKKMTDDVKKRNDEVLYTYVCGFVTHELCACKRISFFRSIYANLRGYRGSHGWIF